MSTFQRFEEIEARKAARSLTKEIYDVTETGPFSRDFGLKDQIRRASVSAMSNIAEGFERGGNKEFVHFLSIAKGSLGELRSLLWVTLDRRYIEQRTFDILTDQASSTAQRISRLMSYLAGTERRGFKFASHKS